MDQVHWSTVSQKFLDIHPREFCKITRKGESLSPGFWEELCYHQKLSVNIRITGCPSKKAKHIRNIADRITKGADSGKPMSEQALSHHVQKR